MAVADPLWDRLDRHVQAELLPRLRNTRAVVSLVTERSAGDAKFAVELDRPIIAVVAPGTVVPVKLARVVDQAVDGDLSSPAGRHRAAAAVKQALGAFRA